MKRTTKFLSALLALCCLLSCIPAQAEAFTPYEAVIANPLVADRLNIREKPDAEAASLGRFYSGTPVYVMDETADQEGNVWAYVQVGYGEWDDPAVVRGYARREFLMRKNRNYGAPEKFVSAEPANGTVGLKTQPKAASPTTQILRDDVWVLGDVGDDWRYVMLKNAYGHGYVKTSQLKNRAIAVYGAFIAPSDGGEKAQVYADKELTKPVASVYAGAYAVITDFTRDGWAYIKCLGTMDAYRADESSGICGYAAQKDLQVFVQPWGVETKAKTGYALQDIPLAGEYPLTIPKGAALVVMGEKDGKYQVNFRSMGSVLNTVALVDKSLIYESGLTASQLDEPVSIGFVKLPMHRDSEGYAEGSDMYAFPGGAVEEPCFDEFCEVLAELPGGYLQARTQWERSFYVQEPEAEVIYRKDLWAKNAKEQGEGVWTADQDSAGLWLFAAEAGQSASLSLENEEKMIVLHYEISPEDGENASYAVYVPAGTKVTLEGHGTVRPMKQDGDYPVLLSVKDSGEKPESEKLFEGSGRFFCDAQLADFYDYYSFRVRPVPGAKDPYFAVSSLFDGFDEQFGAGRQDGDNWFVDLAPGEFLTLHECELYIFYGNG